jgi:serine/threonine protein kinase
MADETEDTLLITCPDCGTVIDVTDEEPLSAVICPTCGTPSAVASQIDHFELVDILGRGGMGVVYRAHDTSLDRPVALKLLKKSEGATQEQIDQLATEAAITASINHPHVVKVYTTGMDRGRFYIAMELVDKGTLDSLIELQGRVAETQVLEVGIQIAEGLRAALHAGLIHRDIKPGNILFSDAHTAKIVDFGLAVFMEDEEKVRGEVWGTPYYVAPEKLDNKPEDFRSDIYSLGGTLFHALAGRPPFEAENASMVALKHLKSQAVSLQAFAPWVSGSTAFVINRTLSKDPDKRYQSYDELIEHLRYARAEMNKPKPQGNTRVIIETDTDEKATGWLVLLMIGLIIAAAVAAFIFRDKLFKAPPAPGTPKVATPAVVR